MLRTYLLTVTDNFNGFIFCSLMCSVLLAYNKAHLTACIPAFRVQFAHMQCLMS